MKIEEYLKSIISSDENTFIDVEIKKIKKNTKLTSIGEIEKNIYYLVSGIVEAGMIVNNEEKIIEFLFPKDFPASYTSFITRKPSDVYITCLTDCEVQTININQLRKAAETSLLASNFYNKCLEKAYIQRVKKEKDFLILNAEERYAKLVATRPYIVKQIPVFRVAKYLGIHPDSLSRIRNTKH